VTASILFVCRANLCRSPSAEVMLTRALAGAHVEAKVSSAGMEVTAGQVPPEDFVELALIRGIDLRAHVPSPLSADLARSADVILTMTRSLLRTMVLQTPAVWPRSFTLLELVRRGTSVEPPGPGDTLASWLARVHASRDRAELISLDPVDDLRDPMVDAAESNEEMFGELERATRRLARLLAAVSG
jgi:low molecular weight protein-tyrosine phosphatase